MKLIIRMVLMGLFFYSGQKAFAVDPNGDVSPSTLLTYKGKPSVFDSGNGIQISIFHQSTTTNVEFLNGTTSLINYLGHFDPRKDPKGILQTMVVEPTGVFYQDKVKKIPFFVAVIKSREIFFNVFSWNGRFFGRVPFALAPDLAAVKNFEHRYSNQRGLDYFVANYRDGSQDAYYLKNHFLVLDDSLLDTTSKFSPKFVPDAQDLSAKIVAGDWDGAIQIAQKIKDDVNKSKSRDEKTASEINIFGTIPALYVEKSDYESAIKEVKWGHSGPISKYPSSKPNTLTLDDCSAFELVGDQSMLDGQTSTADEYYQKALIGLGQLKNKNDENRASYSKTYSKDTPKTKDKFNKTFDQQEETISQSIDRIKQKMNGQ